MMAPTLVVLVRVVWLIIRHKQDAYWMLTDLVHRKDFDLSKGNEGLAEKQTWIGKQIALWSGPEGKEYRVESQAIRQAPDHHSRLK
jgi:hypothetical protein